MTGRRAIPLRPKGVSDMPRFRNIVNGALMVAAVSTLAGCVTPDPKNARFAQAPKTPATKTITSFTPALRCMDRLFAAHGQSGIGITTAGIPDSTGKVQAGTKDMLINAVNRMVTTSNAFEYIDYDATQIDLNVLFEDMKSVAQDRPLPAYYIRGAVTQLDENATDSQVGAGIALPFADIGVSEDQRVSIVSLDMSIGDTVRRTILPGVSASNSIAVVRSGQSGDAGGKIGKAGLSFNISLGQSEGLHAAVRSLVELTLIEVLGKLTNVPYWKCLQVDKTNPLMMQNATDWYDAMAPKERNEFFQRKLKGLGYFNGPVDGQSSPALTQAISQFQARNDLIADGRMNFDLYYRMLDDETALAPAAQPDLQKVALAVAAQDLARRAPVALSLSSDRGDNPVYAVGESMTLMARPAQDAFLYCYYGAANGTVARIFPNRFHADPFVTAGTRVQVPGPASPFRLTMDTSGAVEEVQCFASSRDPQPALPEWLQVEDLTPVPRGLDDISNAFAQAARGDLAAERLTARVQ